MPGSSVLQYLLELFYLQIKILRIFYSFKKILLNVSSSFYEELQSERKNRADFREKSKICPMQQKSLTNIKNLSVDFFLKKHYFHYKIYLIVTLSLW